MVKTGENSGRHGMQWVNILHQRLQPKNLLNVTNKIKNLKGIYKVNLFEKKH